MRSRIVIDIFHAHRLCVSRDKIVRVTIGLSKVTLNLFKHKKQVLGNLRTNLCTIEAKNNIDKNSRCTISKPHCPGTTLSLFQFPSTVNLGVKRYYEKYVKVSSRDCRKERELPSFYTEFEEIKDPPEIFFLLIATANIPDKKAAILTN